MTAKEYILKSVQEYIDTHEDYIERLGHLIINAKTINVPIEIERKEIELT